LRELSPLRPDLSRLGEEFCGEKREEGTATIESEKWLAHETLIWRKMPTSKVTLPCLEGQT